MFALRCFQGAVHYLPPLSPPVNGRMSINGLHLLLIQGVSMLSRKDKKQVITQEKKIIYGDEELSGKEKEIGQAVQAYTHAAKWF